MFRHQLGTHQKEDSLIYEETNPDFEVDVSTSNSQEYITFNIKSLFEPKTNEIWFKHAKDEDTDFSLISPMQYGVNYSLKHGEQFFYKLTNEEDGINYKIVKIPLPTKYLLLSESNESSEYKPKDKNELDVIKNRNELQLFGSTELIKTNYDAKILDFEVTKHYM